MLVRYPSAKQGEAPPALRITAYYGSIISWKQKQRHKKVAEKNRAKADPGVQIPVSAYFRFSASLFDELCHDLFDLFFFHIL